MKYSGRKSLGRGIGAGIVAVLAAAVAGHATAGKIDTGNPDGELRWDNTVKYNAGWRMQERNNTIGDAWGYQAGDYKFDKGDMVTNRVDLFTEIDYVYKSHFGFRVSGAAWYDAAYDDTVRGNPQFTGFLAGTAYPGNKLTPFAKRYNTRSGELLDAFLFGRIELGTMPLSVKAGRHTVYWGESLFTPIHGVSFAQSPADFRKALITPQLPLFLGTASRPVCRLPSTGIPRKLVPPLPMMSPCDR